MQSVKIGILGLGTVGSGTVSVLKRNSKEISRRAGRGIEITRAADKNLDSPKTCDLTGIDLTDDAFSVVNDPEIQIVVELIGGTGIARDLVMQAIENGKHVVTANKALIAMHGNELFAKAQEKGVTIAFEAAVAGGIPIIKAIREGLAANRIEWLAGIINGTGNFILTEMRDKGRNFADVLAEAQALGYAEADPTFDVEGIDAAHKLTIMASIAFGIPLQFYKAYTEGISKISQEDVQYAEELGYHIKHLGIAKKTAQGVELRVHPTLIPKRRLIANVNGVMNAVVVKGDAVGPTLYYGAGAGAEPTASAVVADIVDIVRALTTDPENRVPHLAFQPDSLKDTPILPMSEVITSYYLRINTEDKPGVLADITRIFSEQDINIEAILQKQPEEEEGTVPIIMLTQPVVEKNMDEAIAQIEALDTVKDAIMRIRMESLG
ncbi:MULTISPECIES: homoserine dehydrogenase [unclassified Methylophaga]|uniref:homoserine dehydrogenase n=1 Tax=unclassified Methylophaga TaxID=2629249 RepID=UPI000C897B2B|nr:MULTISPECIES: homoserine dehydrogenase [unclassified Methylophaga]MAK67780.1 homoserine dehydrogenase [Methylophaga sp.]MAY18461.1 homoserine dehydrogenase [Methylophaga sp.]MBN45910.1 homoserine dehydrogenase [Methylophaga sp.]